MSGIYTKEQQTRSVTNKNTGKTKTFKSTGVDAKGLHFFTSKDGAKVREFLKKKKMGGAVMKSRGGTFKGTY
tara:strand:+ start:349 stop:564 length:216 start_codon:yes stop_codon:yes gene_type:complete